MAEESGPARTGESAQRELADAARRLIREVRVTRAPIDQLDSARGALERAIELLAPYRHTGGHAQADLLGGIGRFMESDDPMEYFPYSPVIGRGNPISPPVEFAIRGGVVYGRVTFTPQFCGPPNHVHGGVVALVFDELLGTVNVAHGLGAMTGTLTIRYRRPTPLHQEVRMEGRATGVDGRKVYAEGKMWHGDVLLAEAEGTFIQILGDMRERLGVQGA